MWCAPTLVKKPCIAKMKCNTRIILNIELSRFFLASFLLCFFFFVLSVEPRFRHTLQSSKHTSLSTDFLSFLFGYPRQMDSPLFTERPSPCELTNCKSTPICRGPHSVSSLQPHDMTTTPTGKAIDKAIAKPKGKPASKAKRNPKKQKQRARRRMMQRKAEWQRQQPHHPPPSTTIIPSAIATTPSTTSTTSTTTVPAPVTTTQTAASVPASVSARFVDIDLSDNDSAATPPTTRLSSSTSSSISKPQRTASYSTLEDATDEHQLYDIIGYDDVGDDEIDDVNNNTPYDDGENKNTDTEKDATSCIIC